uniref:Ataxin 7-like 1 n=1 Tax=Astyanax mexicanus TaxID=7994 RepID=A0A3B1K0K3_ASTMX
MHSKNNQRRQGSPGGSGAPLVQMKGKVSQAEVEPLQFRVPREFPHSRFSRAPLAVYPPKGGRTKACVSLPVVSLEKMPCFTRSEGAPVKVTSTTSTLSVPSSTSSSVSSSTTSSPLKPALTSPASQKNQEKLLNGRGPVTPRSTQRSTQRSTTPPQLIDRRPSPSRSPLDKHTTQSPSPSPSPSSSSHKPSSSPSPSTPDRRPGVPPSPSDRKQPNGAKASRHRKVSAQLQPVHQRKGRVFDPNKHCGVLDPESQRPCTRSLTCKTHSLAHRRAVPGRKRVFDILLAEHKGRANEKEAGQKKETASGQSAQCTSSPDTSSSLSTGCNNGKATPTLKLRLAKAHTNRGSGGGGAVVLSSTPVPVPVPDPVLPGWLTLGGESPVSSDEGEAELPEEKPAYYHTPSHPQPISVRTPADLLIHPLYKIYLLYLLYSSVNNNRSLKNDEFI